MGGEQLKAWVSRNVGWCDDNNSQQSADLLRCIGKRPTVVLELNRIAVKNKPLGFSALSIYTQHVVRHVTLPQRKD